MISYADWLFGDFLEAVDRTGHSNDTAIFLLSDHGEWGGDYGLVEKWPSACDGVLEHIPLIARVPGMERGHVSKEIVELYDVMATCLDLAGIEAQHTHFARSLMPQLQGRAGDPTRAAFCEGGYDTSEPQAFEPFQDFSTPENIYYPKVALQNQHPETITRATSIRSPDFKMVLRPAGTNELYDLRTGPSRTPQRITATGPMPGTRDELRQRMLDWYIHTSDVAPKKHDPRGFPKMKSE